MRASYILVFLLVFVFSSQGVFAQDFTEEEVAADEAAAKEAGEVVEPIEEEEGELVEEGVEQAVDENALSANDIVVNKEEEEEDEEDEGFFLNVGFGIKGGLNGSVVNGVTEGDSFTSEGSQYEIPQGPDIYPSFGLGATVGGFLEVRAWDFIGLEVGFYQSWDNAAGFEDKNAAGSGQTVGRVDHKQCTSAFHIPALIKLSLDGDLVRPTFGLGAEFVKQNTSTLEYSSDNFSVIDREVGYEFQNILYKIEPTSYVNIVASIALEFDFDPIRVPIELRANINPTFESALDPRVTATGTPNNNLELVYDGVFQAQFALLLGVAYDFDL